MKRLINLLTTNNAKTSAIHYFGSFAINLGNYAFHLILLRLLSPQAYGEFLSYISFLYLISIPAQTIGLLISKHVATFFGRKDYHRANNFFYFLLEKTLAPTISLAVFLGLASGKLAVLFKADSLAFIILSISLVLSLFSSLIRSYLLAFQEFILNIKISFIEITIKITLAFLFIYLGLSATGAVLAMLVAGLIGIFISFVKIKFAIYPRIKHKKKFNLDLKKSIIYSIIFSAGSLSLLSVDVILVRLFFTPAESGIYSAISILARMIFFGLVSFSSLMLPFVSSRFAAGKPTKTVLIKISLVVLLFGCLGVAMFSLFSAQAISLLSGANYLKGSKLLPLFSLSLMFLALSYIFLSYFIAVNKNKATLILLASFISQPLLIFLFHQTLYQVVVINFIIQTYLLLSLVIYYYNQTRDVI